MTDSEFTTLATALIDRIEEAFDASGADVDLDRKGDGILEIEFADGSKVVVNAQTPMRQIWVAARSGGFHFTGEEGRWRDTRSGEELSRLLSRVAGEQAGAPVALAIG